MCLVLILWFLLSSLFGSVLFVLEYVVYFLIGLNFHINLLSQFQIVLFRCLLHNQFVWPSSNWQLKIFLQDHGYVIFPLPIFLISRTVQSSFRITGKRRRRYRDFLYTSCTTPVHPPHYPCPAPEWCLCYLCRATSPVLLARSPSFLPQSPSLGCQSRCGWPLTHTGLRYVGHLLTCAAYIDPHGAVRALSVPQGLRDVALPLTRCHVSTQWPTHTTHGARAGQLLVALLQRLLGSSKLFSGWVQGS